MTDSEVTQLVVFRTELAPERFLPAWRPFADGFLARGLRTITLAGFDPAAHDGIAFVSRNSWPADAYRRAFPSGLAADGAAGPVSVTQAGVFAVRSGSPVASARPELDLGLSLLRLADPGTADDVVAAMLAAAGAASDAVAYVAASHPQRYDVAITVHGPPGTAGAAAEALRDAASAHPAVAGAVHLAGRELLSMPA